MKDNYKPKNNLKDNLNRCQECCHKWNGEKCLSCVYYDHDDNKWIIVG